MKSEIDFLSTKLIYFVTYANFLLTNSKEVKANKGHGKYLRNYSLRNFKLKSNALTARARKPIPLF